MSEEYILRKIADQTSKQGGFGVNSITYYITMVRPVGSHCWTVEGIATSMEVAEKRAEECRNRKIRFANGSMHLQSTAIVEAVLPRDPDKRQDHYTSHGTGSVA